MENKIRWGILGTGNIANSFAEALTSLPAAEIKAVGSRTQDSAQQFAKKFGIPNIHASYESLVNDPDVDVIYVSTPHTYHKNNTLLALGAGKHVLCEKPLALNSLQVETMISTAQEKNLFLMEAMWMWFFPAIQETKHLIDSGKIGDVRLLTADFGFFKAFDPQHRLFNPTLGGGALLDIGIYPLALALYLFGKPDQYSGQAFLGKTGVDEQIHLSLLYGQKKSANLSATIRAISPCEAVISGSEGFIRIHKDFWHPEKISLSLGRGEKEKIIEFPHRSNGMDYEAQHVMDCLIAGKTESDVMSFQASRDLMEIMDSLRQDWGIVYPTE